MAPPCAAPSAPAGCIDSISAPPAPTAEPATPGLPVTTRALGCAAAGAFAAIGLAIVGPWWLIPTGGWGVAAGLFLGSIWYSLWPLDATRTAAHAKRENPRRATTDVLLLGASLVSLLGVGLVLVRASHQQGLDKGLLVGLCVVSIVFGWGIVHTVFTLRYARLFYS